MFSDEIKGCFHDIIFLNYTEERIAERVEMIQKF